MQLGTVALHVPGRFTSSCREKKTVFTGLTERKQPSWCDCYILVDGLLFDCCKYDSFTQILNKYKVIFWLIFCAAEMNDASICL